MSKAAGGGLFLAAIVLVVLGLILRLDLVDWLIDAFGLLLIIVGVVLGIIGLVKMFSGGGNKSSYSDF